MSARPAGLAALVLALAGSLVPGVSSSSAAVSPASVSPAAAESTAEPTAAARPALARACERAPRPRRRSPVYGSSASTQTLSFAAAVGRADARFGPLGVVRVFDPGLPPASAWERRTPVLAGRPVVTSFRMPPRRVVAGEYDVAMRHFFATAPTGSAVYWTYWHEPEADIAAGRFTAREFKRAWRHLARLAQEACHPRMFPTLILAGWTAEPRSRRDWRTYYPGAGSVSVLAWDPYNSSSRRPRTYEGPRRLFHDQLLASRAAGRRFAIAETGSALVRGDTGTGRAAWLTRVGRWTARRHAAFVTYYDSVGPRGVDYRLTDTASTAAWARVVR